MAKKKTLEEVLAEIEEIWPGQYSRLPETKYTGAKDPVILKCNFCDRIRSARVEGYCKYGCYCQRSNKRTLEEVFTEIEKIHPG